MAKLNIRVKWALCCATCGGEQESDVAGPHGDWTRQINILVKCPCLLSRMQVDNFTNPVSFEDFQWNPQVQVTYA